MTMFASESQLIWAFENSHWQQARNMMIILLEKNIVKFYIISAAKLLTMTVYM